MTVDVHARHENVADHVPGALLIPVHELLTGLADLDGTAPIHVIDASGYRSKAMTDLLIARGFDAVSVAEGTKEWFAAGKPVEVGL